MTLLESTDSSDGGTVDAGGTYTLLVDVARDVTVEVGALGELRFPAGGYAYTGSALGSGGFARVARHRRVADGDHDVRHWHVDYVLGHPATDLVGVEVVGGADVECRVARSLPAGPHEGFGASDCGCHSHLAARDSVAGIARSCRRVYATAGVTDRAWSGEGRLPDG
ncbi:MAG: DUF123 domain-containing protein [Halolamina sp.]